MKPENLTVFELFQKQLRYAVPLFQRQYVWTEGDQWEPLWDDISNKATDVLDKGEFYYELHRHFLGAVVVSSVRPMGFEVPAMTVVDGQQRITTLQLVLIALRDYARAVEHNGLADNLAILTENKLHHMQPVERFKIWPTNADQRIFEDIFSAGSPGKLLPKYPLVYRKYARQPEPRPRLIDAYLFFYRQIEKYARDRDDDGNEPQPSLPIAEIHSRLTALERAVTRQTDVVTITLDQQDNPQVIFETLNDRGVQLDPSDLIRNFVFLEAARQKANSEQLYTKYWYDYDKPAPDGGLGFWKVQESQGRKKYTRLDLFVFHYLTYQRSSEVLITRIYKEFQKWWEDKTNPSIETELVQLQEFSKVFANFYTSEESTRLELFYRRLRTLEVTTVYPLLLFLLGERRDQLPPTEIEGLITDIESYLVRRQVCGLTTKNYNRFFLSVLSNLQAASPLNRNALQALLLEPTGAAGRWPTDEEFRIAWLSQPAYRQSHFRAQMILQAIDREMKTDKRENIQVLSKLTVEHLLPQKWHESDYPLPRDDSRTHEELMANRAAMIHTFGNLTLLTSALNSAVSNGPFRRKRSEIAAQSALAMNAYLQNLADPFTWDEKKIHQRGDHLFQYALKVWPRPAG